MEKVVSLLIFITILSSSCANRKKTNDNDRDYCEIVQSIKIDSLGNFSASWRGEAIRLVIYTKKDTIGCLLKQQQSDNKIIMFKYNDSWLPIDSIRNKESLILNEIMINQIKYCFKLMNENKYRVRRISRDLNYKIKIISIDSINFFYIPDTNIYGVDNYIKNNNLKNICDKWWVRND